MSIGDLIRKKPLSGDMRRSSSSEETAPSKAPKDVLGLGMHLVRQLGMEDEVDTLGRWLAHRLAELMVDIDNSESGPDRSTNLMQATDIIIKLWERRAILPGNANPLAEYKEAIAVLRSFSQRERSSHRQKRSGTAGITQKIEDNIKRMNFALSLLGVITPERTLSVPHGVIESLSDEELELYSNLNRLPEMLKFVLRVRKPETKTKTESKSLAEQLQAVIAETINSLNELSKALALNPPQTNEPTRNTSSLRPAGIRKIRRRKTHKRKQERR